MLLRSSSTPLSQIHLFAESPNRDIDHAPSSDHHHHHHHCKVSFHLPHSNHVGSFSCNSSPHNNNLNNFKSSFRKVQSDGNLKGLLSNSDLDEVYRSKVMHSTPNAHNQENVILQTEPSFSIYHQDSDEIKNDGRLVRSVTIGNDIANMMSGNDDFTFGKRVTGLIIKEDDNEEGDYDQGEEIQIKGSVFDRFKDAGIEEGIQRPVSPMYVAAGFGIGGNGMASGGSEFVTTGFGGNGMNNGGSEFVPTDFGGNNGDFEAYYKMLLKEYPSNPLFLRNYAQLLQSKGDLAKAEEYYYRATLADPKDGDISSQYAKLVWQLHHDKDKALNYFERAAHAAPEDSQVLAAYASFLWEIDDDNNENDTNIPFYQTKETEDVITLQHVDFKEDNRPITPPMHLAAGFGIDTGLFGGGVTHHDQFINVEDYYRSMVQENPNNPLLLRNYAQFLHQCKGDIEGAAEYYARAILADASDGEIISQYAKLTWQLHHDKDKASYYFKRAIQVYPGDSNVLAAYARFLWETENDEDAGEGSENRIGVPHFHGALATTNA